MTKALPMKNRVTAMTGTDYPIIQAPMGWIARAQLASAVSNAGGMGVIEPASGEFDNIRNEVAKMRDLTDKPFGMNVALSYVKGTDIIDFVIKQNIKFVTTSSGSPNVCTQAFQEAGIKVFHVVPTLDMALKAIDCGVDGLVVEGGEGGGFKNPSPVSTMVLLPLIRRCRSSPPVVCATACPWRVPLPWGRRACRWGPECSAALTHPCTTTGSRQWSPRRRPIRCFSTNNRGPRCGHCALSALKNCCHWASSTQWNTWQAFLNFTSVVKWKRPYRFLVRW